jgi:hypothetical protein
MHNNPLAAAIDSVTLGVDVVVHNLTMIPLVLKREAHSTRRTSSTVSTPSTVSTSSTPGTSSASPVDYFVLDDALTSGAVEITEVSDLGSVPDLKFVNRAARPVLIVDGEELLGARQNRIVNLTILVAANSAITIPVSCVEAGRWRSRSRAFTAAPRTQYATGRAKRMADVSLSMMSTGDRVSDQADVWHDIAQKSSRMSAASPTSAMEAIFSTHAASIDEFVDGCRPVDGQVGALFAVGGVIVGFDLFDRESTLRKMLPKLVRSVSVDAIDAAMVTACESTEQDGSAFHSPSHVEGTYVSPDLAAQAFRPVIPDSGPHGSCATLRARAAQFLAVAAEAPQRAIPAIGLGDDVRLTAPHIAGAALLLDYHVVHFGAFAV